MAQSTTKSKSLIAKLKDIAKAIDCVEKRGHNDFAGYHYQKASDVARAFRGELFKRNILLMADEKDFTERDVETMGGGRIRLLTLRTEYTFHDADTGEKLAVTAFGSGMDNGDKAIYKAKTGALKYLLRGLGIIPDERDDPEADTSVDEQTDARAINPPSKRNAKKRIVDYQVRAFDAACHSSGKTAPQIATYLSTTFKLDNVLDLNREQFDEAMKWACAREEDMTEILEASIRAVTAIGDNLKKRSNGTSIAKTDQAVNQ